MSDAAETLAPLGTSIDEATVVSAEGGRLVVRAPGFGTAEARSAIAGTYEPRAGDVVLVATAASGARYVVGALRALRATAEVRAEVRAADGASARLEGEEGGEVLRLRDSSGAILFEHRPGAPSVLRVPIGDLEIRTDAGDVVIAAAGRVRIAGREGVVAHSDNQVSLRSGASELRLDGERTHLHTGLFAAKAERADAEIGEVNLVARTVRTVAQRIRTRAGEVESQLGRVIERARESYREVEELAQTRAGRLKLIAEGALHVFGESTEVKAREDVKIKGEKIHLG